MNKVPGQALAESEMYNDLPGPNTLYAGATRSRLTKLLSKLSLGGPNGLLLLLLFVFIMPASPVSALNFNAFWAYRQAGGDEIPTRREYQQRYTLGLGGALVYQPTHAITAFAAIGYTGNRSDSGEGFNDRNELSPTAQLSLINDIFGVDLSGNSVIKWRDSGKTTQNSWAASLGSNWVIPLWPSVRFSYSEFNEPVEGLSFFENTGVKETTGSFNLTWDLILANFVYRYGKSTTEDSQNIFFAENISHFGKIDTGGALWDNRLRFNFSQQVSYTDSSVTIKEENGEEEGNFFDVLVEGQSFAKVDKNQETDPDPPDLDYEDPNQPLPPEITVNVEERIQIRYTTASSFPEQIDLLRLTLSEPFAVPEALNLQWLLYTRSEITGRWEQEAIIEGEASPEDEDSIELIINLAATDLLIVAVNDTSISLTFTNCEGYTRVTSDNTSTNINSLTNFGIGYRITDSMRASASLILEHLESESNNITNKADRQGLTGSLRWTPYPFISPALNFSEYRDQQTNQPDRINRTYALNVATYPMERLDVNFGATHGDRYIDEQKTFSSDRFSLTTKALIYPDLTADWSIYYTESDTLESEGLFRETTSLGSRLEFKAQLYRDLTANLTTGYSRTESNRSSDNDTRSSETGSARLELLYRPSDLLSLRGSYVTSFLDSSGAADELNLFLSLGLLRTYKTRLVLTATHSQADTRSDNLGLNGSWTISRYFSMLGRASYRLGETNAYNFYISLSFRL